MENEKIEQQSKRFSKRSPVSTYDDDDNNNGNHAHDEHIDSNESDEDAQECENYEYDVDPSSMMKLMYANSGEDADHNGMSSPSRYNEDNEMPLNLQQGVNQGMVNDDDDGDYDEDDYAGSALSSLQQSLFLNGPSFDQNLFNNMDKNNRSQIEMIMNRLKTFNQANGNSDASANNFINSSSLAAFYSGAANIAAGIGPSGNVYRCEHCPKFFYDVDHLQLHNKRTHGMNKMNECDICGKTYAWKSGLYKHKRHVHGMGLKGSDMPSQIHSTSTSPAMMEDEMVSF